MFASEALRELANRSPKTWDEIFPLFGDVGSLSSETVHQEWIRVCEILDVDWHKAVPDDNLPTLFRKSRLSLSVESRLDDLEYELQRLVPREVGMSTWPSRLGEVVQLLAAAASEPKDKSR